MKEVKPRTPKPRLELWHMMATKRNRRNGLILQHNHAKYSRGLWRMNDLLYVGSSGLHESPFCSRFPTNQKANKQLGQFIFSCNTNNNYTYGEG